VPEHHPSDPLLDREMSMTALAKHFGVTLYRIKEMKGWELVEFKPSYRGGFFAWVAKPVDFLDVPLYFLIEVARYCNRKSSRTIRRWFEDGHIELSPRPRSGRLYATPRQLLAAKRYADSIVRVVIKPNPKNLLRRLESRAARVPPPDVSSPAKLWRRRP